MEMVHFLYKRYHVFFLHFVKHDSAIAWVRATTVLTFSFICYFTFVLMLTGLFHLVPTNKGVLFIFYIIPLIVLFGAIVRHLIFTVAQASKKDGSSERYNFTPTKRDKIISWLFFVLSPAPSMIYVGIEALLEK